MEEKLLTLNSQLMMILTRHLMHVRRNFLAHGASTAQLISRVSTLQNAEKLRSRMDADEIAKDLVEIGNLNEKRHCLEALVPLKEKHKLQIFFLKVLQEECLETHNHYWYSGIFRPGVAHSNNSTESHFKNVGKEVCPKQGKCATYCLVLKTQFAQLLSPSMKIMLKW